MDPFTQKLLQRTNARKEQLAKKREELATYRGTKHPTSKRMPLCADNKDNAEEIKRIKIISENYTRDTQKEKIKNAPEIDANSPSIKARKERLIEMQQKAKENVPAPKKHWKKLDLAVADKESSPSVAARSAVFQTKAADKDKVQRQQPALSMTPRKLAQTRDIFEKETQHPIQSKTDAAEKKNLAAPAKPPRLAEEKPKRAVDRKHKAPSPPVSEASDSDTNSDKSTEQKAIKRKAPSPPPNENGQRSDDNTWKVRSKEESKQDTPAHPPKRPTVDNSHEKDQTKLPILDEGNAQVNLDVNKGKNSKPRQSKVEVLNNTTVVMRKAPDLNGDQPAPKPRKRLQDAENCGSDVMKAKANARPEEMRDKHRDEPARKAKKTDVIFASAQVVAEGSVEQNVEKKAPKKAGHERVLIQACIVESSENHKNSQSTSTVTAVPCGDQQSGQSTTAVTAVPCGDQQSGSSVGTKVTRISPRKSQASRVEAVNDVVAATGGKKTKELKDKKATSQNKFDRNPFKVPEKRSERPQHEAHDKCLDESLTDGSEAVNDVNIHEITFNFDFSKFDEELQGNKEGFQMSYEETCKKLEQEGQPPVHAPNLDDNKLGPSSPGAVTVQDKGVHVSGYNSMASKLYATKVKFPNRHLQSATEKTETDKEKIKTMLEKAAFQQNIVLQASRAVNLCAATNDVHLGKEGEVEAERVLLLATERRQSCLNEVQRLKTTPPGAMPEIITECDRMAMPCQSTVYLEGVQLFLKQEFMHSLCNGIRSDMGIFYFVYIVEQGPDQVFCSRVQSTTNATEGALLKFPDKFVLENVKPNFVVTLKMFAMNVKRILGNLTTTPKHKRFQSPKVIKNKLSGRRSVDTASSAAPLTASPQTVFRTSSFSLVGVTHITLPLINSKKFTLDQVPEDCPVNNNLQMNMQCIPMYTSHVKGFLTILEDVGGYSAWQRRWCTLEGGLLQYWRYPGDETTKAPLGSIDLGQCVSTTVSTVSRDLCARPNTMELKVMRNKGDSSTEVKYLLAADTKPDRTTWLNSLNDAVKDFRAWNPKPLYPKLGQLFTQDV